MKNLLDYIKQHKEFFIAIALLLTLFFIGTTILTHTYNKKEKSLKEELKENNKEKQKLFKERQLFLDSADYWKLRAEEFKRIDTVIITKIIKEKQKTNEEVNSIPTLSTDSLISKHAKLTEEYINTRFER